MKEIKKCKVKGCDRKIRTIKHGLCTAHTYRMYRTGKTGSSIIRKYEYYKPYKF